LKQGPPALTNRKQDNFGNTLADYQCSGMGHGIRIYRKKYKNIFFFGWFLKKVKTPPHPLFMPRSTLHVNKIPIHLVTKSFYSDKKLLKPDWEAGLMALRMHTPCLADMTVKSLL
jgi:hypothetical protein